MGRLDDRSAIITSADRYMGPAIAELFRAEGADVVDDTRPMHLPDSADDLFDEIGIPDILVANLATPAVLRPVTEMDDETWTEPFRQLVDPLARLLRGVLPGMVARGSGKVIAVTSATPLRPIAPVSAYASARGAQHVLIQHAGVEVAASNVQVNAVAQNFVRNEDYYPDAVVEDPGMARFIARTAPAGRVAEGWEAAELVVFLASPSSDFICGQVIPFAGGSVLNV
jgi:2-keto-3-deoxy-L-fuconate dehydrogenase